jgi:hypothetical protein
MVIGKQIDGRSGVKGSHVNKPSGTFREGSGSGGNGTTNNGHGPWRKCFHGEIKNIAGGAIGTYNVLVRIHVYFEAILFAFVQYTNGVVHKIVVIDPTRRPSVRGSGVEEYCHDIRSSMLKSFPGDRVAQYVKTPTAQTGEVNVGRPIVEIEWARNEAVPASLGTLPKPIQEVRGFTNWSLCRTGKIDPAK